MMALRKQFKGTPENTLIYTEIFCAGCEYATIAFGDDKEKVEAVKGSLVEVMGKLVKVATEKSNSITNLNSLKDDLIEESKKGIDGLGTYDIAANIENFLSQSKGALDVFSNTFLTKTVGYKGKWSSNAIIKHFESIPTLDKETVEEIRRLIQEDQAVWLKTMIDDRNMHHEANFSLSEMLMVNGSPTVILTRSDGRKTNNLEAYVVTHWENVFGLIKDMMHLTIWAIFPALKGIELNQEYFMPKENN